MLFVFLAAAAAQLFFWGYFLRGALVPDAPSANAPSPSPSPVSVIVCFRNEEATLERCLRGILAQDYSAGFELLAVDDNSTDGSADIVRRLIGEGYHHLRLLQPGPTRPGKKDALTFGIHNAHHEFLLLTDADCYPATPEWITRMTAPLHREAALVLGLGLYDSGALFGVTGFQDFESKYVALKYMGFAQRGLPYMGVGRNLAYTRTFFVRAGGLEAHADLPGGDDDLLVGGAAREETAARVVHPDAVTFSAPVETWGAFFRQRRRHQSTGLRYRPVHQLLLGLLALSHGLFFLLGLFLLFSSWWWLALTVYAVRFWFVCRAYRALYFPASEAGAPEYVSGLLYAVVWGRVAYHDALMGPFYMYLGVVGLWPGRGW